MNSQQIKQMAILSYEDVISCCVFNEQKGFLLDEAKLLELIKQKLGICN